MTNAAWVDTLKALAAELTWTSEIDAPFTVVQWHLSQAEVSIQAADALTPELILQLTGHKSSEAIQVMDIDAFFSAATEEQDWFGDEEKAITAKYRLLVEMLKQQLQAVRVYRVGEVRLEVYVLGQPVEAHDSATSHKIIGLATQAVET